MKYFVLILLLSFEPIIMHFCLLLLFVPCDLHQIMLLNFCNEDVISLLQLYIEQEVSNLNKNNDNEIPANYTIFPPIYLCKEFKQVFFAYCEENSLLIVDVIILTRFLLTYLREVYRFIKKL